MSTTRRQTYHSQKRELWLTSGRRSIGSSMMKGIDIRNKSRNAIGEIYFPDPMAVWMMKYGR